MLEYLIKTCASLVFTTLVATFLTMLFIEFKSTSCSLVLSFVDQMFFRLWLIVPIVVSSASGQCFLTNFTVRPGHEL